MKIGIIKLVSEPNNLVHNELKAIDHLALSYKFCWSS